MAKKVKAVVKLNLQGGTANPGPPAGPALGQYGVPIMNFLNQYNEATKDQNGKIIPAVITIYEDRSFEFITKLPPVSAFIKEKLDIETGAHETGREEVGELTEKQVEEIAKEKMPDLNTTDLEAAKKIIKGTAKSMGVTMSK